MEDHVRARPLRRILAVGAAALGAAGCGSSSSSGPPAGAQATSGPAAVSAVSGAYATLFDLANPALDPKVAVVQDGASLRATLAAELKSPLAKQATGAVVSGVQVEESAGCDNLGLSSPCATVAYDILGTNHKPLFPSASKGYALYSNGKWLVAKETICGLLSLAGSTTPAGC